ncbi:hypothetical protein PtrSN002B_003625 [Pyrenophora tritici-repentis]|uniref:Uncharacterized protein n=2 Tax=Pyrenophora tritici-repentis TaxID=45151 RepID=A0A2W1D8U2_9PLEO|nr:uncharacterized protein PTRG_07872 [Pyrenophora tritici-repentis Pt-1C-BFP]KAA8616789.1 hypothetical protein PtrV1_10090 [Pyrenophora tritici-repentis]EDU50791.1 predicted protein [Pyrenophora tritici-repentis Pt-1C-BFP]KAF7446082.1 hypothetical protein A1F99_093730 [Pyrenophora tritici-repentis]KAF7567187.1 hypothetical protein PtrM4_137780 [Pyrenophora tritici-repentis]KAG9381785.1 hypothetical protein A1F94_007439 [Pyrenophora tritici-repentis]
MSSPTTTDLFLALIVLTSTILVLMLIYFFIRFISRDKIKDCQHQELDSGLLDPEPGRESRLLHRLSRQQIQQEHYEDLHRRYSSAPSSPAIELLPEIKTESVDDRASEWLERGAIDSGVRIVDDGLGERRPELQQAMILKPKKQLRWDWKDGKLEGSDGLPKVIEKVDKEGVVLTEHNPE